MTNFLVSNEHPKTKNLLIECLVTEKFERIISEKGFVSIKLAHDKFSISAESEKSNTQNFIFPSIPKLREVFEFIELNYHQCIRLKEVAQAVGYSSAYLTDLVRRLTGKTVNNWIIERRLAEASTLLLETNYSVEEIALKVGYQNINHFYCQFHNYYQNTPRDWGKLQRSHAL
jgi:AraC family transcriptional regulator